MANVCGTAHGYVAGVVEDGKRIDHYACSNELRDGAGSVIAGIGTFCHEFGHVLGMPDLYSTTYTTAFTPGEWSIMDHGSYNNQTRTPPLYSVYERYCMNMIASCLRGSLKVEYNGNILLVEKGDIFICPPNSTLDIVGTAMCVSNHGTLYASAPARNRSMKVVEVSG